MYLHYKNTHSTGLADPLIENRLAKSRLTYKGHVFSSTALCTARATRHNAWKFSNNHMIITIHSIISIDHGLLPRRIVRTSCAFKVYHIRACIFHGKHQSNRPHKLPVNVVTLILFDDVLFCSYTQITVAKAKPIWNARVIRHYALSIYCDHVSLYNSRKTPHRSPVRARYRVSFVSANMTSVLSL